MSNATSTCSIDWAAIGALLGAAATFIVAWIAWKQLDNLNMTYKQINKTSKADFAHRCNTDFFTPKASELFMLFENDMMVLHILDDIDFAYFEIDKTKLDMHPIFAGFINNCKHLYSAYEIDDILLGPLDNVGSYFYEELMDIELVDNFFGYYIKKLHANKKIEAYIKWIQSSLGDEKVYDKFDAIYAELIIRKEKA